jgi:hypothetical protein
VCDKCVEAQEQLWCTEHAYFDAHGSDAEARLTIRIEQATHAMVKLTAAGQRKRNDRKHKKNSNKQLKCKGQVRALKKQLAFLEQQLRTARRFSERIDK